MRSDAGMFEMCSSLPEWRIKMKYIFGVPSAGAGPFEYEDWPEVIGAGVVFKKVNYQKSLAGPYIDEMDKAAETVAESILEIVEPYDDIYMFGHCMGASVAYEAAGVLLREHGIHIRMLFVSAFISPNVPIEDGISDLDDEAFTDEIMGHGTFPEEFFIKKSVMKLFLPRIRADYKLIENYCDAAKYQLDCPIIGFFAENDEMVPAESYEGWKDYTTATFEKHFIPGDHYAYYKNQKEIISIIEDKICESDQREI
jgi:surfactin synthase thioesterase subunit